MKLGAERSGGAPSSHQQITVVSVATVLTVLAVIFVVQGVRHQPVLVTSLASSVFLLYWQPLNEVNRFKPLVFSHLIAMSVGYAASLVLPPPYASAAVALAVCVPLLSFLRLVHPPAISTSLVFSYRPQETSALSTFVVAIAVVVALAFVYLLLRWGVQPRKWAHLFGFE